MFRNLSLDGGGIKVACSAAVLEQDSDNAADDHFNLITGTSTGGIIALEFGLDRYQSVWLKRLAQAAARKVKKLVVFTLKDSVPRPPANLPEEICEELARLVCLSDQEPGEVAQATLRPKKLSP